MPIVKQSEKKGITHNPTFVAILGFLLTGLVGAAITLYVQSSINERMQREKDIASRKEAARAISNFIFERRANAVLLANALQGNAPIEEIRADKTLYDKSSLAWDANIKSTTFQVIDIVGPEYQDTVEKLMGGGGPIRKIFRSLDNCLQSAYAERINKKKPTAVLDDCPGALRAHESGKPEPILERMLLVDACGSLVADLSWKLASPDTTRESREKEITSFVTKSNRECAYFEDNSKVTLTLSRGKIATVKSGTVAELSPGGILN